MSASPTFWLTVAAVFGANALLSWAWGAPVLAVAQLVTATLAGGAAWTTSVTARHHARHRSGAGAG